MNLFGIGIDVIEIDRIRSSVNEFGESFLTRIFTKEEREYCEKNKKSEIHFAARFAAKEAVSKALGTGIGKDVAFTDIEIVRKSSGEPEVKLTGNAKKFAEKMGVSLVKISLTHAEHYAAANAVAMQND